MNLQNLEEKRIDCYKCNRSFYITGNPKYNTHCKYCKGMLSLHKLRLLEHNQIPKVMRTKRLLEILDEFIPDKKQRESFLRKLGLMK